MEKQQRKDRRVLWIKFLLSAVFCLPLLYLAIVPMIWWLVIPYPRFLEPMQYPFSYALVQIALTIPVLLTGYRFFITGFKAFIHRSPNMDSLIAIGATASMGYSLYSTYLIYTGNFGATDGLYFITAGAIITLAQLGKLLEAVSRRKAGKAVQKMIGDAPNLPAALPEMNGRSTQMPAAGIADTAAGYFVPFVCAIAVLSAYAWVVGGQALPFTLTVFLSILVIACPGAIGLALPASIAAGLRNGVKHNLLIKDREAIETARKVDIVVFAKSGTITRGYPEVTDIVTAADISSERLLQMAASAQKGSGHELGEAIARTAEKEGIVPLAQERFENIPGYGIAAEVEGTFTLIGSRWLMEERGVSLKDIENESALLAAQGKTVVYIALDGQIAGIIATSDEVADQSKKAMEKLASMGIETAMITGGDRTSAQAIAMQASIARVLAEVSPKDMAAEVEKLKAEGKKVAMAGFTIHDAPALSQADIIIAIGPYAALSLESADIILPSGNLLDVPAAIQLCRNTIRNIRENLFWAFGYHVIGIPVAAGLLHLGGGPLLNPVLASSAMILGTVSVLANTLRLKRFNFHL